MKKVIDLTNANFDRIDFSEANIIDFFCQEKMPNTMEFTTWGATLLMSSMWKHKEPFDFYFERDDEGYLAGLGVVRLEKIVAGKLKIYLYENIKVDGKVNVAKNYDGSELFLEKEWGEYTQRQLDSYLWECVIKWPYGFCNMELFSEGGSVRFQFDTDDIIPSEEYIENSSLYHYDSQNNIKIGRKKYPLLYK